MKIVLVKSINTFNLYPTVINPWQSDHRSFHFWKILVDGRLADTALTKRTALLRKKELLAKCHVNTPTG